MSWSTHQCHVPPHAPQCSAWLSSMLADLKCVLTALLLAVPITPLCLQLVSPSVEETAGLQNEAQLSVINPHTAGSPSQLYPVPSVNV